MSKQEQNAILRSSYSLPNILKKRGYSTIFVSPHIKNDPFNTFIELLGFDTVCPPSDSTVSEDRELYARLAEVAFKAHASGEKFFLSAYVLGTHHGWDSPHVKYGDGSNSYLNKFHNQDHWFGKFFEKLETSGTAEFKRTFNSDAPYFADRIPLFLYTEGIRPQVVDAQNQNSLCLAPTILNILGMDKEENCFLGNSLFCKGAGDFSHIANIGHDYFDSSSGTMRKITPSQRMKEIIEKYFWLFG